MHQYCRSPSLLLPAESITPPAGPRGIVPRAAGLPDVPPVSVRRVVLSHAVLLVPVLPKALGLLVVPKAVRVVGVLVLLHTLLRHALHLVHRGRGVK